MAPYSLRRRCASSSRRPTSCGRSWRAPAGSPSRHAARCWKGRRRGWSGSPARSPRRATRSAEHGAAAPGRRCSASASSTARRAARQARAVDPPVVVRGGAAAAGGVGARPARAAISSGVRRRRPAAKRDRCARPCRRHRAARPRRHRFLVHGGAPVARSKLAGRRSTSRAAAAARRCSDVSTPPAPSPSRERQGRRPRR